MKSKFTEDFFEEFQYDPEFRSIFLSMEKGLTPFQVIEHLCKSKKALMESIEEAIKDTPREIVVTHKRFWQLKKEINQ